MQGNALGQGQIWHLHRVTDTRSGEPRDSRPNQLARSVDSRRRCATLGLSVPLKTLGHKIRASGEIRPHQILDATLRNRTPLTCLANTSPLPHVPSGFQEGVIEIVQKRLHAYAYHDLETHMPIEKTITKRPLQSLRTRPNFWAKSSPAERLSAMAVICQTHDDGKPQSRLSRLHYFFGTKVR